jgi:Surface antigen variable number repeat
MEGFDPYHPIEISKIEIQGNERTRESYFQHAFSGSARCQNINELHEHLSSVTRHLRDSGLFEGVEANIRICDNANQETHKHSNRNKSGSSYNIAVDINVKEVGIPQLKMESYIQTGLRSFSIGSIMVA